MLAARLNNGVTMPTVGLGVAESGQFTARAVHHAITCGYRLIDTAAIYNNERQVGEGIRASGIPRGQIFITSKLWLTDYGHDNTMRAFGQSLGKLGVDYIDLYLLHWPCPANFAATVESFRAIAKLAQEKRIRAVGVSNFTADHLKVLVKETDMWPAVNQVELHPLFSQRPLRQSLTKSGIRLQSWSPLGGPSGRLLKHPTIAALASKYARTPAQIVLRWHLHHGLALVAKSVKPARIAENIALDFTIKPEDVAAIDAMNSGKRSGADPAGVHAKTWPDIKVGP